jgi:hypothetical protein
MRCYAGRLISGAALISLGTLSSTAAQSVAALHPSCRAYDVYVSAVVAERGLSADMSATDVAAANRTIALARLECSSGHLAEAIDLYESFALRWPGGSD